ncbi:hypothetical protein ACS0TY_027216 [Phlomoides rotata]
MEMENSRKREHFSIEIGNEEDVLLTSIKEKMETISLSHIICRVPEQLHKGYEYQFFPSLVSIGPFHHGRASLKLMPDQKWRYLNSLLSRKPDSEVTLATCIKSLRHLETKARKFYCEPIEMGSDQFVEMLLLDGCFLIELLLVYTIRDLRRRDDPCFERNEDLIHLRRDLIMFENQIPFFILDHLFHLVPIPIGCHFSLVELASNFFKKMIPHCPKKAPIGPHLLDLIRQHYLPTSTQLLVPSSLGHAYISRACGLSDVGISIERRSCESPSNITFFDGKLNIPSLEIHCYTEALFRNLIAMEQCQPGCSKHVSSYVSLMNGLISSKRDVRLLQEKEILLDGHETEGGIVLLFKSLHVDVNVMDFYYRGVCEHVSRYQGRKRDVFWVRMRNLYHKSNLGVASFSLVVLVVVFLFTGAFFSAVSFLLHHFQ